MDSEHVWDELFKVYERLNDLLTIIPPTPKNKEIREEIIQARAHVSRAQSYT